MITSCAVVILLVCGLLGGGDASLTEEEKAELLTAHNFYRANVEPVATNMAKLEWDDELALLAQFWAVSCRLKSNEDRHEQSSMFDYVGEILAASGNSTVNLTSMVDEWYYEGSKFNYSTATCEESYENVDKKDEEETSYCGRYVQLVWAQTYKVGCGAYRCEEIKGLEEEVEDEDLGVLMVVCDYGPGGGYVEEQPYETGEEVCTACPYYQPYCEDNLCTTERATHGVAQVSMATLLLLTAVVLSLL